MNKYAVAALFEKMQGESLKQSLLIQIVDANNEPEAILVACAICQSENEELVGTEFVMHEIKQL